MPSKVSKKTAKKKSPARSQNSASPSSPDWADLLRASTHDVRRLDSVIRFSSIPVTFSESTATHSFWVALYSLMIWQSLAGIKGTKLPLLEDVLRHAVTHDLSEMVAGDVVRTLKYSTPEMKQEVDRAEKMLMDRLSPYQVRNTMLRSPSKDVLAIVKAADFMSLWQFMRREAARKNLEIMPYFRRMIMDLLAKERENDRLVGGLYKSMRVEADAVAVDCFGGLQFSRRWHREIP